MAAKGISVVFYFTLLFHSLHIIAEETKTGRKCFETVLHYYSNPKVTGTSETYFTYRNSFFHNITIPLSCESPGVIEVKSVDLLLPANEGDYCLDSKVTNFTECTAEKQCPCCVVPNATCNKTLHQDNNFCNYKTECMLTVTSEFLYNCSGRTFDCNKTNCHSRWAQVVYRCNAASILLEGASSGDGAKTIFIIGAVISLVLTLVAVVLIIISGCWLRKNQKQQKRQKEATGNDIKMDETLKDLSENINTKLEEKMQHLSENFNIKMEETLKDLTEKVNIIATSLGKQLPATDHSHLANLMSSVQSNVTQVTQDSCLGMEDPEDSRVDEMTPLSARRV